MVKNLKLLRQDSGVSQQQLATALGISQQSVNKYENHGVEPDISILIGMANFFNTTVDHLVGNAVECGDDNNVKLSANEIQLVKAYRSLDDRGKRCVLGVITAYKGEEKKQYN